MDFSICCGDFRNDNSVYKNDIVNKEIIYIKKPLITRNEKIYLSILQDILKDTNYILQSQVNLASIINKQSNDRFQNELFRNVDFCIFNTNYSPIVIIEINDSTHSTVKYRQYRDIKVKEICKEAEIPIITLWTNYKADTAYVKKRLSEYIEL